MSGFDPGRMQPWTGGESPLDPARRVIVEYRDGITSKIRRAGDLRWEHLWINDDIVAFAAVEMGDPPAGAEAAIEGQGVM